MDTKEIQALKEFQRALLSVNNSLSKLGVELESVALTISQHQVNKIKDQLDRRECGASKFYIPVDDDSFKLSGITISRSKGELSELEQLIR